VGRSVCPVGYVMVDDGDGGNGNGNEAGIEEEKGDGLDTPGVQEQGLVTNEGKVRQFLWNWRAQQVGLEGMGVTLRYSQDAKGGHDEADKEIALTWNGWAINRLGDTSTSLASVAPSLDEELGEPQEKKKPSKKIPIAVDDALEEITPKKKHGRPKKVKP